MSVTRLIWAGCRRLGLNALGRRWHRRHLLVLCYHGVVAAPREEPASFTEIVSAPDFEAHLQALGRRFTPVSGEQVRRWLVHDQPLPPRPVLVTFDDGYANNLHIAAPLLRRYCMPAVFFLTTGYLGTNRVLWGPDLARRVMAWPEGEIVSPAGLRVALPGDLKARQRVARAFREEAKMVSDAARQAYLAYLRTATMGTYDSEIDRFLTWEEARQLAAQGFELGSHTVEHSVLSRLEPADLARELTESKATIVRETGAACTSLAYPFGRPQHYSLAVLAQAEAAGYEMAFTVSEERRARPASRYAIGRVGVAGGATQARFEAGISGVCALLRR